MIGSVSLQIMCAKDVCENDDLVEDNVEELLMSWWRMERGSRSCFSFWPDCKFVCHAEINSVEMKINAWAEKRLFWAAKWRQCSNVHCLFMDNDSARINLSQITRKFHWKKDIYLRNECVNAEFDVLSYLYSRFHCIHHCEYNRCM